MRELKGTRMKVHNAKCLLAVLVGIGLQASVRADNDRPSARADDEHFSMENFHFPVGVGISSGHFEVFDKIKDLYRASGFQIHDERLVPVGLLFSPYYEFNCGFGV